MTGLDKAKRALWLAALVAVVAACGSEDPKGADASSPKDASSSDPKTGWVTVGTDDAQTVTKHCDGTTLIYLSAGARRGGIAVIPGSSECTR